MSMLYLHDTLINIALAVERGIARLRGMMFLPMKCIKPHYGPYLLRLKRARRISIEPITPRIYNTSP